MELRPAFDIENSAPRCVRAVRNYQQTAAARLVSHSSVVNVFILL